METNFFKDIENANISGGTFTLNSAPDYSTNTTNYNTVRTINDNSRHTTTIGTYTNYGQHATGQGQINNHYGPQTPNNGSQISGYWPGDYTNNTGMRGRSSSSYARGQPSYAPPPRRPHPHPGQIPSTKAPRPKKNFDPSSPEFEQEYNGLTPEMKAYLRNLGHHDDRVRNQEALNEDDSRPQRVNSPPYYGHRTPVVEPPFWKGRRAARRPSSRDFDEEELASDAESVEVFETYGRSAAVFNDNRVVSTNINSNNVNTTNVQDSYNDNSTRTDVTKRR